MGSVTKKWLFLKVSSAILLPLMLWFSINLASVYDKGYNFSRRYLPGNNVSSFNLQQPSQTLNNSQFQQSIENSNQSEFNTFDQLPILE